MSQPIIHFDYDFSPFGQKTKLLLTAAGVQYKKCDQPRMLPRPDLEALGITYRRIPLLAIGKDVYVDSALMIDTALSKLGSLPTTPADKAWETWGTTVFREVAGGVIPVQALTKEFVKDRETIFPMLKRNDLQSLRPSALAGLKSRMKQIEEIFLANSSGPFIGGEKISLADVHVIFGVRWALYDLGAGQEKGFGKQDFPKVYKLIESLPQPKPEVLSAEDMHKTIRGASYSAEGPVKVAEGDSLGISAGTAVNVESFDSQPGVHIQAGKLIGSNVDEFVLEVGNDGVRLHYPKIGYIVRAASQQKL